jgi:hypothetical protein
MDRDCVQVAWSTKIPSNTLHTSALLYEIDTINEVHQRILKKLLWILQHGIAGGFSGLESTPCLHSDSIILREVWTFSNKEDAMMFKMKWC